MASIRILYEYRSFADAPITTAVEKRVRQNCHPLVLFSGFFFFVPLIGGFGLLSGRKGTFLWKIMGSCSIACAVIMFLVPIFVKHLWLKKKIAEEMAFLERKGNLDPQEKYAFWRFVRRKLSIFLIPWVFLGACAVADYMRPLVYDTRMHSAFADGDYAEGKGDLCTVFLTEEDRFTTDPIPVWMAAEAPGQVGYILRVSTEEYLAGYATDYNIFAGTSTQIPVYMYACNIDWVSCDSGTVVKRQRVEGAKPERDSQPIDGAYYGSDPVDNWRFDEAVTEAYEELLVQQNDSAA